MGVNTENCIFGTTLNPWDRKKIVGVTSGGCGALISVKGTKLSVGRDLLGSIRAPAHFIGV